MLQPFLVPFCNINLIYLRTLCRSLQYDRRQKQPYYVVCIMIIPLFQELNFSGVAGLFFAHTLLRWE